MPTTIMARDSGSPLPDIDPGVYQAAVTEIEEVDGQYGLQFKFSFTLDDITKEDGSPVSMWGWCSQTLSPQSKLWKWATTLGLPPTKGKPFDVMDLEGKPCGVMVNLVPTEDGDKLRLVDVLPPKKGRGATGSPMSANRDVESRRPSNQDVKCFFPGCKGEVTNVNGDGTLWYCPKHVPEE